MTILVQQQLRKLAERATPGPWELQTSNSWRRIGTAGGRFADGDVLAPTTHRGDNHPDLAARQEDLDFIVAADPNTVLALLDELDQLKAENAELRRGQSALEAIATMPADQIRDTYNWAYYAPREIGSDAEQIRAGMTAVLRKAMTKEQP